MENIDVVIGIRLVRWHQSGASHPEDMMEILELTDVHFVWLLVLCVLGVLLGFVLKRKFFKNRDR